MTSHPRSPAPLRLAVPALLAAALLAACGDKKTSADATYTVTLRYCSPAVSGTPTAEAPLSLAACSDANQTGLSAFTPAEQTDIRNAADRIQKVIAAGLRPAQTRSKSGPLRCFIDEQKTRYLTMDEEVHGLLVLVMSEPLSGTGVLAESGPCIVRDSSNLPLVAVMRINADALAKLKQDEQLYPVAFHELFHTLGFGTMWTPDPITHQGFNLVTGSGTSYAYTGPQALAQAKAQNKAPASWTTVPVDNTGLDGTAGSHWRQDVFSQYASTGPWELMTGRIPEPTWKLMPALSATTLGAIADLGYAVSFSQAEPFQIPFPTAAVQGEAPVALRAEGEATFDGDTLRLPIERADDSLDAAP